MLLPHPARRFHVSSPTGQLATWPGPNARRTRLRHLRPSGRHGQRGPHQSQNGSEWTNMEPLEPLGPSDPCQFFFFGAAARWNLITGSAWPAHCGNLITSGDTSPCPLPVCRQLLTTPSSRSLSSPWLCCIDTLDSPWSLFSIATLCSHDGKHHHPPVVVICCRWPSPSCPGPSRIYLPVHSLSPRPHHPYPYKPHPVQSSPIHIHIHPYLINHHHHQTVYCSSQLIPLTPVSLRPFAQTSPQPSLCQLLCTSPP